MLTNIIDTRDTCFIRMGPRRIPYFQQRVQQDISAKEATNIVKNSISFLTFLLLGVRK